MDMVVFIGNDLVDDGDNVGDILGIQFGYGVEVAEIGVTNGVVGIGGVVESQDGGEFGPVDVVVDVVGYYVDHACGDVAECPVGEEIQVDSEVRGSVDGLGADGEVDEGDVVGNVVHGMNLL